MIIDLAALGPVSHRLAAIVGYVGMMVGFYVIFICEERTFQVLSFGILISGLGTSVFTTINYPDWLPGFATRNLLVTTSLVLILIVVLQYTWVMWRCYHLKPPHVRTKEVLVEFHTETKQTIETVKQYIK